MNKTKPKPQAVKHVMILGQCVMKRDLYLAAGLLFAFIALLVGVAYAFIRQNQEAQRAVSYPELPVEEERSLSPLLGELEESWSVAVPQQSPLKQLLEAHSKATGLDKVSGYIAEGTFGQGSADEKIVLMARAPNFLKYRTEYLARDLVVEFGHNGEQSWVQQSREVMASPQAEFFKRIAIFEASMSHLAWSYRSSYAQEHGLDAVLQLLPAEAPGVAIVRSRGLLPMVIDHYIDTETYQETQRRAKMLNDQGDEIEVRIDYDAAQGDGAYRFPHGYQLYVDGALKDTVKFSKLRVNDFMLSALFDAPESGPTSD